MEIVEQKQELFEVEEEQEQVEEESTLLVRKSRTENDNNKSVETGLEVSNGVTHTNGHAKTESSLTENGDSVLEADQKIEEPNGILGTGEPKSETLVFHDEVEGVEPASEYSGEERVEKDTGHDKLDIAARDFTFQEINNHNGEHFADNGLLSPNLQPSQSFSQEESSKDKSSTEIESVGVDLTNENEIQSAGVEHTNEDEIESAGVDVTSEDDLEAPDLDVEKVLKEQKSHDLYCPNCNSCITRRVILRKRKRRIRISDEEVKRNKTEVATVTKLGIGSVQESSDEVGLHESRIPTIDDDERERGPDIFRCLSCFSIFIPSGNGFKLFSGRGGERLKENVVDERVPNVKKNWFSFMFTSNKQATPIDQGSSSKTNEQTRDIGVGVVGTTENNGILDRGDENLRLPRQEPSLNGKVIIGAGDKLDKTMEKLDAIMEQLDTYTSDQLKEPKSSTEVHVNHHDNDLSVTVTAPPKGTQKESADDVILSSHGGLKLGISSNKGSSAPDISEEWEIFENTLGGTGSFYKNKRDKDVSKLQPPSDFTGSDSEGKLNISVAIPHEEQHVGTTIQTEYVENKHTSFARSNSGQVYPTEVSQQITTNTKYEVHPGEPMIFDSFSSVDGVSIAQGKDTVITIGTPQPVDSYQTPQGTITPRESAPGTQIFVGDRERTQVIKETRIEVIKSIVYGGLAESVTSLSVVSSAAGGNTATLNIVALGMANLIGGLFIICHNLWELRSDSTGQASTQISNQINEPRDRYRELLGRRQNFVLHAVVSIISYIIFGLLPPVVYGFSFRKSDDKEFKLLVVAAVSLVCILMLAIGRAYVQRPPKRYFKTVLNFVTLGIMVSGVSYAAGMLVERLLQKYGLFQTSSPSDLVLLSGPIGRGQKWGSI